MSSELLSAPSIDSSRMYHTNPRMLYTPPVARTSTFTKTSARILTAILLVGLSPGVAADCNIDAYVVTVIHPCSSQHPSYSLPSSLSNDCGKILNTQATAGITVAGGNNTPPILVDALSLTPGLRPPPISSRLPRRRTLDPAGLSHISCQPSRPRYKCR
jgi:hypothetical protein